MRFGPLVADAKQPQRNPEKSRSEDRLVVGADRARTAVSVNRVQERPKQRDGGLVRKGLQANDEAAAVVHDAQDRVDRPLGVHLAGEIDTPHAVGGHFRRDSALPLAPPLFYL